MRFGADMGATDSHCQPNLFFATCTNPQTVRPGADSRTDPAAAAERCGFYGLDLYSLHTSAEAVLGWVHCVCGCVLAGVGGGAGAREGVLDLYSLHTSAEVVLGWVRCGLCISGRGGGREGAWTLHTSADAGLG